MNNNRLLNRREFLKVGVAAGGGILIGIYLPQFNSLEAGSAGQLHPNAFLRIAADDVITVILGKSEMGTGIYTALPMMLVEELDAAWENVRVEAAPVDRAYFHPKFGIQMTGGSSSVTSEWERLRKAGATARAMLVAAAVKKWDVVANEWRTRCGQVTFGSSNRLPSYGICAVSVANVPFCE